MSAYLPQPETDLKKGLLLQLNILWEIDKHYARKEYAYFTIMEKYGMMAPPKIMWGVDDEIRDLIKEFRSFIEKDQLEHAKVSFDKMRYEIEEMIVKEEEIMIPMIQPFFNEDDWIAIAEETEEIGYCIIQPEARWQPKREAFSTASENSHHEGTDELKTKIPSMPISIGY